MHIKLKRLHIFLLKSFAGPFFLTFFIVLFIMVMQFMFKYINDLIGKGLEFQIILEFLFYLTASMVPMALPLALLMAALMTFGNLGEHYELTALKSSRIPFDLQGTSDQWVNHSNRVKYREELQHELAVLQHLSNLLGSEGINLQHSLRQPKAVADKRAYRNRAIQEAGERPKKLWLGDAE